MNRGELRVTLTDDLSTQQYEVFYSDEYLNRIINRGVKYAARRHPYKNVQRIEVRTIEASDISAWDAQGEEHTYLNLPENWIPDSVSRAKVNGTRYTVFNPQQYENYLDAEATGNFARIVRNRIYFSNVLAEGDVVEIHGIEMPTDMTEDTGTHVFYNDPKIEEAIIEWCLGSAYKKGRGSMYNRGIERITEANRLLDEAWLEHGDSGFIGVVPNPRA